MMHMNNRVYSKSRPSTSDLFRRLLEDTGDSGDSRAVSPEPLMWWDPAWGDIPASPIPDFIPPLNLPDSPPDSPVHISQYESHESEKSDTCSQSNASGSSVSLKERSYEDTTASTSNGFIQDWKGRPSVVKSNSYTGLPSRSQQRTVNEKVQHSKITENDSSLGRASKRSKVKSIGSAVRQIARRHLEQGVIEEHNNKCKKEKNPRKVDSVNSLLIEEARSLAHTSKRTQSKTKFSQTDKNIPQVHRRNSSISVYKQNESLKGCDYRNQPMPYEPMRMASKHSRTSLNGHTICKNKTLPPLMKSADKRSTKAEFIKW